jgi:hypothetical protein
VQVVAPVNDEAVPTAQGLQVVDPDAAAYVPTAHVVQERDPNKVEYDPAGQRAEVTPSSEKEPGGTELRKVPQTPLDAVNPGALLKDEINLESEIDFEQGIRVNSTYQVTASLLVESQVTAFGSVEKKQDPAAGTKFRF